MVSKLSRWSVALGIVALLLALVAQSYLGRGLYRDEVRWLFIAGVAALIGAFPARVRSDTWPESPGDGGRQLDISHPMADHWPPPSIDRRQHLAGHILALITPFLAVLTLIRWLDSHALIPRQLVLLTGLTVVTGVAALLLTRVRHQAADNGWARTEGHRPTNVDHVAASFGLSWANLAWPAAPHRVLMALSLLLALLAASYWWRDVVSNDAAVLWLISLGLFSYAVYRMPAGRGSRGALHHLSQIPDNRGRSAIHGLLSTDTVILVAILVVATFMRGYQLADLPYGSWYDEAESGLEAVEILNGRPFSPMAKFTFNPSFYFYALALSLKILGKSILSIRLVVAVAGVLSCLFLYLLVKRLLGWRTAFVAAFLLAVMSWHVTFSRFGMPNVTAPLFAIITLYFLIRGLETGCHTDYLWAGLAAGIGVYTYTSFRLVALIVALLLGCEVLSRPAFLRRHFEGLTLMAVAAVLVMLPLGIFALQHPAEFTRRMSETSVFAKKNTEAEKRLALDNSLRRHLLMFNVRGDPNGRHGLPGRPMVDPVMGGFLVLGLGYSLYRWRNRGYFLAAIWLAIGLMGGIFSLDWEAPQGARTVVAMPAVAMLAAVPLGLVWEAADGVLRRSSRSAVAGLPSARPNGCRWVEPLETDLTVPPVGQSETDSSGEISLRDSRRDHGLLQRHHLAALGVLLVLAYVGRLNFDRYFNEQMKNVEVFHAHSARETATARYVNTLGPGYWIYLQTADSPIARLIADRREDFRFFMPIDHLPLKESVDRDIVYLFEPWRVAVPVEEFLRYYPDARVDTVYDPAGEPIFHAVRVSKEAVDRIFGLTGRYHRGPEPQGQPFLTRTDRGILFEDGWSPLPPDEQGPFSVEWRGTFFAPQPGKYELDFRSRGASWVSVDGELVAGNRGDPSAAGSGRVSLAKGLHSLEIRLSVSQAGGGAALYWTPPGHGAEPIPAHFLFTVPLSDEGLLGRYYRGTDWQGLPQVQQVDRVLSFRWHDLPVQGGHWSVEWRGKLLIEKPGRYRFAVVTNDRGWVTIDGQAVIQGGGSNSSGDIELSAGEHDIVVRYVDTRGYSEFRLYWELPGVFGREIIPSRVLSPQLSGS